MPSSSSITESLPSGYGYVILSCVVLPTFTSLFLGDRVMRARKEFKVNYPNLYAVPGFHGDEKKADAFNRVQRGHQNFLENIGDFRFMALVGGLKHPYLCAFSGAVYCLGSILYQKGYADTKLDVKYARFKKGGAIKYIGYFSAIGSCISVALSLIGKK